MEVAGYDSNLLEDIETIKVIDELRSALCSLNSVNIEQVQVLSELRGDIGKDRLLSLSNMGTSDGIRVEPRIIELLVDYRPDMSWVGKSEEWKAKAMLVIMISCRRELLKTYPKIALCPDADQNPFLDIELVDIACTDLIRRRVCARAFYQTPFKKNPSWIINGRWMPNPDDRTPPPVWDPRQSSYEAYLDLTLENKRVSLRRNHYILSLNESFETWRTRSPSLPQGLQQLSKWTYDNYLGPVPKEWLMSILICGMIYCEKNLGFDGQNRIPAQRIANGPTDDSSGASYNDYRCLEKLSSEELFRRALKCISLMKENKSLLLPLTDDKFTPHDPSKPLVEFEPNNYFDYLFVVSRCWQNREKICASYPKWYLGSSFDPRGLLINCPSDDQIEMMITLAKSAIQGNHISGPITSFKNDIRAIICLKTPRSLLKSKVGKDLARFKNISAQRISWKKIIPEDVDDVIALSECLNLRLRNLAHEISLYENAQLLYKPSLPYPLMLIISKPHGQISEKCLSLILQSCDEALGQDIMDQICTSSRSIDEILKFL